MPKNTARDRLSTVNGNGGRRWATVKETAYLPLNERTLDIRYGVSALGTSCAGRSQLPKSRAVLVAALESTGSPQNSDLDLKTASELR